MKHPPPHEKSVTRRLILLVLSLLVHSTPTWLVLLTLSRVRTCDFVSKLTLSHEVLLSCHVWTQVYFEWHFKGLFEWSGFNCLDCSKARNCSVTDILSPPNFTWTLGARIFKVPTFATFSWLPISNDFRLLPLYAPVKVWLMAQYYPIFLSN